MKDARIDEKRTIVKVQTIRTEHANGDITVRPHLLLSCGHYSEPASHLSYRAGDRWYFCEACGKESKGT